MSSRIIPLLPRTELNGSFLGNGATQTLRLPTINVVPFHYLTLILRVHEATWSSGAYFRIEGCDSFPTAEDAREFAVSSPRMTATALQSAATPPYVTTATVLDPQDQPTAYCFDAILKMSTTAADLFVVVSADLLLRAKEGCRSSTPGPRAPTRSLPSRNGCDCK